MSRPMINSILKFKITLFFSRGTVIPPTFQFNVPKIKFGLVSYGEKNCVAKK